NNLSELAVTTKHALMAGAFKSAHKDPFDRLLAAQAISEDLPLLTADKKFGEFSCRLMWAL
ncbi:MAG TPA: PIN domain-containing protein, partial [Myxococcota bacterium]|nr:PIN domain-containing protein [Myxococcota bacterium]